MSIREIIRELDKDEENRKADYTIWGFLYQFNLVLLDMLNDGTVKDVFKDGIKKEESEYQIEVVEDYIKYFNIEEKEYVRVAQVKYNSRADKFSNWGVILDLYYDYLKLKNYNGNNINYKACILYNTKSNKTIERESIIENGRQEIENYMNALNEVATTDKKDKSSLAKKIEENIGKDNQINRQAICLRDFYSKNELDIFLKNMLYIVWNKDLNDLTDEIKDILFEQFPCILNEHGTRNKKDILYALSINYLYNKWSNKRENDRLDEVFFKPKELYEYIKIAAGCDNVIVNYAINNIIENIKYIENEIKDEMIDEGYEVDEIDRILISKYKPIFINIINFFRLIMNKKINRFKLLNTVYINFNKDFNEYDKLSEIDEVNEFSKGNQFLLIYLKRLIKFMINESINIEESLDFEKDIIIFKNKKEKRQCALFSHAAGLRKLSAHRCLLEKLIKSNQKPTVWYFDKVQPKYKIYKSDVFHPTTDSKIKINYPEKNDYFIECMECLEEESYINCNKIECIYREECVANGEKNNN